MTDQDKKAKDNPKHLLFRLDWIFKRWLPTFAQVEANQLLKTLLESQEALKRRMPSFDESALDKAANEFDSPNSEYGEDGASFKVGARWMYDWLKSEMEK